MANSLELHFINNPNAVFSPNQVVAGTVVLRLREAVKARGLRLIVKGKAECKWSESSGSGSSRKTTYYTGKEKYLNSVTYLFGSEDGESVEVPVGVHTYNFECLLPESLPYSVEGKKGFIRYKVETTLDIPWGFDYESEKPFTVVRYDDLNLIDYRNYRQSCEAEEIKTFGCLCFESDPLILTVRVPRTGFGLGGSVPVNVKLVNRSTTNVYATEFRLKKVEQFNSTSPKKSKMYPEIVNSKAGRGVRAGENVTIEEFLEIPRVLSTSNEEYCNVFQIKYFINFKARTDGMSFSPEVEIPITIGNVGITTAATATTLVPPVISTDIRIQPVVPSAPLLSNGLQPQDDLPPSFEEATRDQAPFIKKS